MPKSLFDGRRRIIWGWVRDLEDGRDSGKPLWGGTMSMARELFADDQGRLRCRPPEEVTAAFNQTKIDLRNRPALAGNPGGWHYERDLLVSGAGQSTCLFDAPDAYLLDCQVRLQPGAALTVGPRCQEKAEDGYRLVVRPGQGRAELHRGALCFERPVDLPVDRPISLQVFVQGSIIECFVAGYSFTCRAYEAASGKLGLSVSGGKAEVLSLKIKVAESRIPAGLR